MKIIVFGDIHGNLPALEVALREARAEGYDLLVHTGDLAGFAPYPEETIAQIRDAGIPGVRGDVDDRIVEAAPALAARGADPAVVRFEERAYAWTLDHLHRTARGYLGNLPFEIRLEAGGRDTVLLHATPIDNSTCFWEDRDEDFFREMGDAAEADILIFGHTHRPYHRVVDGRHFINAGSVGFPQDGDARTGYAVIRTNGNVEVQYRRYPYDTRRLLKTCAARGFPKEAERYFRV